MVQATRLRTGNDGMERAREWVVVLYSSMLIAIIAFLLSFIDQ